MGGRTRTLQALISSTCFEYDPSGQHLDYQRGADITRQPDEQHGLRRARRLGNSLHLLRGRLGSRADHGHSSRLLL